MNKVLKQSLFVVSSIFLFGWMFNNPEISGVLKEGIGMTIMCAGIIMGICVFFPISINMVDKIISIFWAGALIVCGAALHKAGITWAILSFAIYLIAVSIYFSPLIEAKTLGIIITTGISAFVVGIFLIILSETSPLYKSIDQPTEKPYVEDKYEYPCEWSLWVTKNKKHTDYCWEFSFGKITGTLESARETAKQMMEEWESKNPNYTLLNKDNLIEGKNIVFVKKIR